MRDQEAKEVMCILSKGNKVLNKDTILNYNIDGAKIRVAKNILSQIVLDSVIEYQNIKDTILKKEVFESDRLVYRENIVEVNGVITQRIEEYKEGEFFRVIYRRSKGGNVFLEKQIHQIPNLNYEKKYYYDNKGLPIKKEVFRNSVIPESIIYYTIKYGSP